LLNLTYPQIANKVGLCEASVQRVVAQYKRNTAALESNKLSQELAGYKTELKQQSIGILKTALTPTRDQDLAIKAAPTAIAVMKGIGEFDSGIQSQGGIAITINLPSSLALPDGMIDVTPRRALPHVVVEGSESNCDLAKCNGLNKPNF